jgi:hypothetical protein
MADLAKVTIYRPEGCTLKSLSINGLSKLERDLAYGTQIMVDGKVLLCSSFKLAKAGTLILEVNSPFEITNFPITGSSNENQTSSDE